MPASKSLYERVAQAICDVRDGGIDPLDALTVKLAEAFREDNPRFNVEKFLDAADATDLWEHVQGNDPRHPH